jgi:holo-[acyl-carrier protein] synthase
MTVLGIGTDLVEVARIAAAVERQGDRFLARVFTRDEVLYCAGRAECLAARFAAKEAVAKAFGTGIGADMAFTDIEVIRHPGGRPGIALHGAAAATAAARKMSELHLSLSHTANHAIAYVLVAG